MGTDEHTLTMSSGETVTPTKAPDKSTEQCSLPILIPGKSRTCVQRRAIDVFLEHQREKLMMVVSPTFSIMVLFLECLPLVRYY
jgi:hypothetical protein